MLQHNAPKTDSLPGESEGCAQAQGHSSPGLAAAESFDVVYRRNVGYVYRLLRNFGVATSELEDATQELFLIVHRRLPEFDPTRGAIRTWLYAIARGVAANRRRGAERRLRLLPPAPVRMSNEDPELTARRREVLALVQSFLETLPDVQREAFELVDIEGLRGPEVAELLGVKVNTIYTRLRGARLAFKAYVAKHDHELRGTHA